MYDFHISVRVQTTVSSKALELPSYPATAPASRENITEMRGDGFSRRNVLYPSPRKLTCAASEGTQLGFQAPVLQSSRLGKDVKIARKKEQFLRTVLSKRLTSMGTVYLLSS